MAHNAARLNSLKAVLAELTGKKISERSPWHLLLLSLVITEVNFGGEKTNKKQTNKQKNKTVVDAAVNSGDMQKSVYRCRKSESKTEFKILNKKEFKILNSTRDDTGGK